MLSKQKQAFDIAEVAAAARLSVPAAAHSSSPPSSSHPVRPRVYPYALNPKP